MKIVHILSYCSRKPVYRKLNFFCCVLGRFLFNEYLLINYGPGSIRLSVINLLKDVSMFGS